MHQIPEDSIQGRKKAPPHKLPDTYRIFNIDKSEVSVRIEKVNDKCVPQKNQNSFQESYVPEWRNNPQPHYAKLINTNVRFLNEPIYYMETEGTMDKQQHWWPRGEPYVHHYTPTYDRQSTQRHDFQKPTCTLSSPIKYSSKLQPSCGIGGNWSLDQHPSWICQYWKDRCLPLYGIQEHCNDKNLAAVLRNCSVHVLRTDCIVLH